MSTESRHDSRRVLSNVASLAASEITARAIGFVATAHIASALAPEGFGLIGLAVTVVAFFTQPLASAFNDVGSREVARRPHDASVLAVSGTIARLALSAVALPVYAAVAFAVGRTPASHLIFALSGVSLVSVALDTTWVYRGLERAHRAGLALLLGQASYAAIVLLAVSGASDLNVVPIALGAGEAITSLVLLRPFLGSARAGFSAAVGIRLLRQMSAVVASRFLRSLYFTFDVVLLGILAGNRAVGLYTAPYRICYLALAISAAINAAYLPSFVRGREDGPEAFHVVLTRALEIASAAAAPIVAGGIVLAAPLLATVFGPEYAEGAMAFQIVLLSVAFTFVSGMLRTVLIACNRSGLELLIVGSGAALNVALNVVLIPRYGIEGAAATTALCEGACLALGLFAVRTCGVRFGLRPVVKPLLASALMVVFLIALGGELPFAVRLAAGACSYTALLALLRGIPTDLRLRAAAARGRE